MRDVAGVCFESVYAHLALVQGIVNIEYGLPTQMDVARWVTMEDGKYVEDDDKVWWVIENWAWKQVFPEVQMALR